MEFFFKEHKNDPLVIKGVGYFRFTIRNGVAEVEDVPDIDPKLEGKAKQRATKQRQAEVEAWHEAARELGGEPYRGEMMEAKVETKAKRTKKGVETNGS